MVTLIFNSIAYTLFAPNPSPWGFGLVAEIYRL